MSGGATEGTFPGSRLLRVRWFLAGGVVLYVVPTAVALVMQEWNLRHSA